MQRKREKKREFEIRREFLTAPFVSFRLTLTFVLAFSLNHFISHTVKIFKAQKCFIVPEQRKNYHDRVLPFV